MMAAPAKGGGKAPLKKGGKASSKKSSCYEIVGTSLKRKNRSCPKCGPGIFMAGHKDRWTCGKCGYMEKRSA
jgi:ubiquitin-small subunit ribosomal protein S27Ae